jgi:hypothetical protein
MKRVDLFANLGKSLANQFSVPFIEASAFDGTNVEHAFAELSRLILAKTGKAKDPEVGQRIKDGGPKEKSAKKKCCKS